MAKMMLSTAVTVDSTESSTRLSSFILSCLTRGMTMASEVEPMIAPRIRAGSSSKSVSQRASPVIMAMLKGKTTRARAMAPGTAARRVLSFRLKPHSSRMIIRVMVAKMGPISVKRLGGSIPSTGPRTMPRTMRKRTSGTMMRLNKPVKRWAKKMIMPTKAIIRATSCMMPNLIGRRPFVNSPYWLVTRR